MPKSSVVPAPHTAIGIASLDYNNPVNKKAFQRALDTNFDAEIRAILARPRGEVRLADGSTFRIAYVNAKGASRLAMTRQLPESASRLERVFHAVLDKLGEIGQIRRRIEDVAHKGQALARHLEASVPGIVGGLWNQELSLQLQAENGRFDSHQVDAWLCSPRRNGIVQQQCVAALDRVSKRTGETRLIATFSLGKHTQRIEFLTSGMGPPAQRDRAARDLARMERLLRGGYAEQFGVFRSAREMMTTFNTVTVIEEGRLELEKLARQLVPKPYQIGHDGLLVEPEGNGPKPVPYLSVRTEGAELAPETAKAIDMALWLCTGRLQMEARRCARVLGRSGPESLDAAASRDLLERHTMETFVVAERAIAASLLDRRRRAFRQEFKNELGASEKDIRLIVAHAGELGHGKDFSSEDVGDRHVKPHGVTRDGKRVVVFDRRLSPSELAIRTLSFDRRDVRANDMPVSSTGIAAGRNGHGPRMLYKLAIREYPACLRFPAGPNRRTMSDLLTDMSYRNLDQLANDLYQTVHDDRMHEIAGKIRNKIDEQVTRMRAEMRADLQGTVVTRAHLQEFAGVLPADLSAEDRAIRQAAFEHGRRCFETAEGPIDPEHRARLLRLYDRGVSGLRPAEEDLACGATAVLAHQAGKHDRAAIAQSLGRRPDPNLRQTMTFALHDAFEAGLLPPSLAQVWDLHTPCHRVFHRPADAVALADALVGFAQARHDWARASAELVDAKDARDAWRRLATGWEVRDELNHSKAFDAAEALEGRAMRRSTQQERRVEVLRDRIIQLAMTSGMSRGEADHIATALDGEAQVPQSAPDGNGTLPHEELDRRHAAMREAVQLAIERVRDIDTLVDQREQELRARTDLIVIGRSTLGEFNRWHRQDVNHGRGADGAVAARHRPVDPKLFVEAPARLHAVADADARPGPISQPAAPVEQAPGGAPATVASGLGRTVSDSVIAARQHDAGVVSLDGDRQGQSSKRRHTDSRIEWVRP